MFPTLRTQDRCFHHDMEATGCVQVCSGKQGATPAQHMGSDAGGVDRRLAALDQRPADTHRAGVLAHAFPKPSSDEQPPPPPPPIGPRWLILPLLVCLGVTGCGADAEMDYAGLTQLSVENSKAVGYRVRYLSPPWKRDTASEDEDSNRVVLRIDRDLSSDPNIPAKYQATVDVLPCAEGRAPCARWEATEQLRTWTYPLSATEAPTHANLLTDETEFVDGLREGERSDEDAPYFELLTINSETVRYHRVAYFDAADDHYVRMEFDSTPRLDETEVTRMVKAVALLPEPPQ